MFLTVASKQGCCSLMITQHVLTVSVCILLSYAGFLPKSKQIRSLVKSKLFTLVSRRFKILKGGKLSDFLVEIFCHSTTLITGPQNHLISCFTFRVLEAHFPV